MSGQDLGIGSLLGLAGLVASGAVLPFVPTGAAVSVAGALAEREDVLLVVLVVAFGAAGAYASDLATYAVLRLAGRGTAGGTGRWARWLQRRRSGAALERVRAQVERHPLRTLLLSRLIPGGQLPVLVVVALSGYPVRRYAAADLVAAVLWAALYATIGLAGRAVFPEPWQGVGACIVLVLLVCLAGALVDHRADARRTAST